jgi:WD40 repeat protein
LEISSGTIIQSFENTSSCTVKISPNGSDYAVATDDSIGIFQFENDTPINNLGIKNVNQIKYSPDGQLLAAVTGNLISIINLVDGSTFEKVYGKEITFSPDNSTFATTNGNGTIDIYSISSDETKATLKYYLSGYGTSDYFGTVNSSQCGGLVDYGHGLVKEVLKNGVFSPDGKYIAVKNENYCATKGVACSALLDRKEKLAIYSLKDGSLIKTLLIPPDGYQWPDFKFNKVLFIGDNVITLSEDTEYGAILRVWDINTNTLVKEINPIHPALPTTFTPDNKNLVTYSLLGGSKLFAEKKQPQEKYGYETVNEYEFSLWNIADGRVIENYEGGKVLVNRFPTSHGIAGPERLTEALFSPDGTQFAYNGYYNYFNDSNGHGSPTARIWNIDNPQPTDDTGVIAYAPDGTIAKSNGNAIEILKDSEIIQTLAQDYGIIRCLSYSKDGTLLAAGYDQNKVVVWRLEDGTPIQTLSADSYKIRFSENNDKVIVGSYDSIKIFNLANGYLFGSLEDGSYGVGFDVSPVADLIVAIPRTSWLDQIKIYNTSGSLLRTIYTPYRTCPDVKFSPDGTMLAISLPGSVQIWGIEPLP